MVIGILMILPKLNKKGYNIRIYVYTYIRTQNKGEVEYS